MISMLTVTGKENEIKPLERVVRDQAAILTDDHWNFKFCSKLTDCDDFLQLQPLVDMSCFDITIEGAVDYLTQFRKKYDLTSLLLIADATVSPLVYLKPGIRPDSLLMRPLTKNMVTETLKEFFKSYIDRNRNTDSEKTYVIESKEGRINIPYSDIFYFEARDKKIYIRTLNEEYGFYETIEAIDESLPDSFARCHRSFILNTSKITKIMLSQNIIELTDGLDVPLSRSYKPFFKSFGK